MSHNPITEIQALGIPTTSFVKAAFAASEFRESSDLVRYNQLISQIAGTTFQTDEFPLAQMLFGYLVQEHVRNFRVPVPLDSFSVFELSLRRAKEFVQREPWHWSEAPEDDNYRISNREEAIRIMQSLPEGTSRDIVVDAIVDKLEVSAATALSYIRAAVKEEKVEAPAPKKAKINKKAASLEIVRANPTLDKRKLIEMISTQLDTTAAGAQTYYYAAIKELNVAPTGRKSRTNTKALVAQILDENPTISRVDFLEQAEVRFGVQVTTAQTYYYALIAERKKNTESV